MANESKHYPLLAAAGVIAVVAFAVVILFRAGSDNDEETVVSSEAGSTTSSESQTQPPDGYYVVLQLSPTADRAAAERLRDRAQQSGYEEARVEPFPGVDPACRAFPGEQEGHTVVGCGDGRGAEGFIVLLEGPLSGVPEDPEAFNTWHEKNQADRRERASSRGLDAVPEIVRLEFSRVSSG